MFSLCSKVCAEHVQFMKLFYGNNPGCAFFPHRYIFNEIMENKSVVS